MVLPAIFWKDNEHPSAPCICGDGKHPKSAADSGSVEHGGTIWAVMFFTQLIAKHMIGLSMEGRVKRGTIVNVSSCSADVVSLNRGEYCVSKAGVSMLTKLYAARLAPEGILVHEVRPGVIATDMTTTVQEKYDRLIAQGAFPIARWGTAEDVANAVSLLCSDQLAYTTGNYLDVDGGFHIRVL